MPRTLCERFVFDLCFLFDFYDNPCCVIGVLVEKNDPLIIWQASVA